MTRKFPIDDFKVQNTPFYYYDIDLLDETLQEINHAADDSRFRVHYAVKANANPAVLRRVLAAGLGVDCVSGGEIEAAVVNGFNPADIVFAGVGKTDEEIAYALGCGIGCFNVESLPELENISDIAVKRGKVAKVAIRVNPNIDAHTHHYITTGLNENKFGIDLRHLDEVVSRAVALPGVELTGLHFHIGSQITINEPFRLLCERINALIDEYEAKGIKFKTINVGGGLGIDYDNPDGNPIPDFKGYFDTFKEYLNLRDNQQLHFELGRAVVAQCGSLITRVLYVKEGVDKKFIIVDAGMTDLIRPALYQAHHKIENISVDPTEIDTDAKADSGEISMPNEDNLVKYDVVGPICESSDCFGTDEMLPETHRGDLMALRSAGAYGEIMASRYNMRRLPGSFCE